MVEQWMRALFLFLGNQQMLNRLAKRFGLRFGAKRFVAGESLKSVIQVAEELNRHDLLVTIDHLGEFVRTPQEAEKMTEHCIHAIQEIDRTGVMANLSLKLTSLGLDIDYDLCKQNMHRILTEAQERNIFVRIDMEDYERLEKTFQLYQSLRQQFSGFGLVIQAYLYRSVNDLQVLARWGTNLRLVKGAYKESSAVAFPDKKDVDDHYRKIIRMQLASGHYAAIATHDERMIAYTKEVVKELKVSRDRFEFQMLYGIRTNLQHQLVAQGYRVRVYVPYGDDWYGYFMRRLAERPANVLFVLKGVFKGR